MDSHDDKARGSWTTGGGALCTFHGRTLGQGPPWHNDIDSDIPANVVPSRLRGQVDHI